MVAVFIAVMFVVFVLLDLIVQKVEARRRAEAAKSAASAETLAGAVTESHERPDQSGGS